MQEGYLLGVDIGTYESKGVLTTCDGRLVASQARPHNLSLPRPGWVEHDPEAVWWGDFCAIVRDLLAQSGIRPQQILAVGCSAIAPDLLPVDAQGDPLRMGILYGIDRRATAEIAELEARFGRETIFQRSGNLLSAQSVGPKILWLKHNEPEVFRKADKFVTATTFLAARLTGNTLIDHLTASFWAPLYDFKKQTWDAEMCREIVEPERLPDLAWTSQIAGGVTRDASRQTGLLEGTPVIVGTMDAAAEAVSVGTVKPGQMMVMYGSTIGLIEVIDQLITDERLWACPYIFPGTYCFIAGMATSGTLTRWFRDQLAPDLLAAEDSGGPNAYSALAEQAGAVPAGAEGLVVLPYFSGERSPIHDPHARGVFFGLTLSHTRGHMFRAVLEGIAHGIRQNIDVFKAIGAEPTEVIAVGGGTQNPVWLQAVSDICKFPQRVPAITLGASYGDAFLAGLGVGALGSYQEIDRWLSGARRVEPNSAHAALYDRAHTVYLELYQRNKDLMQTLA